MRTANLRIPTGLTIALITMIALSACGEKAAQPSTSPKPVASVAVSLLAVPFTISVPAPDVAALRVAPVSGDWIDQLAPLAATQVTYRDAKGGSHFLANVMWFTKERLAKVTKPSEPPPGTTMTTVANRVLVVASTVEMPFAVNSRDGKRFGAMSELVRAAGSYAKAMCVADTAKRPVTPVVRDVVTAYFQGKDLLPLTIEGNEAIVRDVQMQLVGTHGCFNDAAGGEGGYVGAVPAGASEAVTVYVHHKPYPATQAPSTFVTLAHVGDAWTIVSEGTAP